VAITDRQVNRQGQGYSFSTKDMPVVINQNLYTSLGIVNGKEAIGVDVIDESAKVYAVGHNV